MRFFTVPDARQARKSVFVATGFIGFFYLIVAVLGLAAIVIVGQDPAFYESGIVGGKLIGGGNMPVMHLAKAVGGDLLLGFISAVAFATILAVVSGLTMAGTSAISHDLYVMVIKKGRADARDERRVSRIASVGIGIVAVALGILFKDQNIAFLVALTFGVAASVNVSDPRALDVLERAHHSRRIDRRRRRPGERGRPGDSLARCVGQGTGQSRGDFPRMTIRQSSR